MKVVHYSEFLKIEFDPVNRMLRTYWKPSTEEMDSATMRKEVEKIAEMVDANKSIYHLANDSDHKYFYGVDEQNWVASTVAAACIQVGVIKYALMLPKALIGELTVTKVVEEAGELPFELRYVSSEQEALDWFALES